VHDAQLEAANVALDFPAGHAEQIVPPVSAVYHPATQEVQLEAPIAEIVPEAQPEHADDPVEIANRPAAPQVQNIFPVPDAYIPA
jgi:hypothetical protein